MEQEKTNYLPDDIDIRIIQELQRDSRQSVRELAARVHRSPTPVFERMRRLEQNGVISGYTVRLNLEKIGRNFTVFCKVKLKLQQVCSGGPGQAPGAAAAHACCH